MINEEPLLKSKQEIGMQDKHSDFQYPIHYYSGSLRPVTVGFFSGSFAFMTFFVESIKADDVFGKLSRFFGFFS